MKGRFSLNIQDMYILFGNLGKYEPDGFALAELDFSPIHLKTIGRLVAHDVVEHNNAHRTNTHVKVEDELKALGAVNFVRPEFDITYGISNNLNYVQDWDRFMNLKTPVRDMGLDFEASVREHMNIDFYEDKSEKDLKRIVEMVNKQVNYGYWQKHDQYKGWQGRAYNDFLFIEQNVNAAITDLVNVYWEKFITGMSFYFDTTNHIFRHTLKRI